ncbi:sulfotransferase [candidate division KSB1 bacterium]|nr:sulfotransferase [candidate division KSB1 bacterium]
MQPIFKNDSEVQQYIDAHAGPEQGERLRRMSERPVIIGGCGRSGTTLLLSVLSCHPNLTCVPYETMGLCPDAFHGIEYNPNPDLDMPFETWKVFEYLLKDEATQNGTRWCEKTPRNVLYFRQILDYFGDGVRLIHIVRDGRDVVTSRHPHAEHRFWVPPARWIQDVGAGCEMDGHPQVFTLRYEDLLYEYESVLRQICDFIGEDFHPNFLQYPQTAQVRESGAWNEPGRKISTRSIGRWKRAGYIETAQKLLDDPKAVELLRHYGYEVDA